MTHYKIIADEQELDKFIAWLPELNKAEMFYVMLAARNKYLPNKGIGTFNSDRNQCYRFLSMKDMLKLRIQRLEAPLNTYVVKGQPVPQEALALYITTNPRSLQKAQGALMRGLTDAIIQGNADYNVQSQAITEIHKSVSRKVYTDFDFDDVDVGETCKQLADVVNRDAVTICVTRGGFHALVKNELVESKYKKSWYKNILELPGVDQTGDKMLPVPGTYQGMAIPRMYELGHFL